MEEKNIILKILAWKKEHDNVFAVTIANEFFVFRALKRKEFTDIQNHDDWTDQDKEEAFCEAATLSPEEYSFTDCLAGIPVVLTEQILSESLMINDGRAKGKLNQYRDEMKVYENQIDCLITEAFPTILLDEILQWDMHKTLYYLSRAEFVLSKLRGLPFVSQDGEVYDSPEQYQDMEKEAPRRQEQPKRQQQKEEKKSKIQKKEDYYVDDVFTKDINEFDGSKNMSMPNMQQLAELQKICPEIDWANDDSLSNNNFDFNKEEQITFNAEDV